MALTTAPPTGRKPTLLETFVSGLAAKTGLDPRVLVAWSTQEGAYAPNGTGGFNFFNLRPKAGSSSWSGVRLAGVSSGNFAQFASVDDAVTETAWWLNHMSNYAGIRAAAGKGTPATQIAAIAASPWDQGHYGGMGGINLKNTFKSIFGLGALTSKAETTDSGLGISWGDIASGAEKGAVNAATGGVSGALDLLPKNPLTSWVGDLTGWVEKKAAYSALYLALIAFAFVLAIVGVLALLGIHPRTVAAGVVSRGALAAA